MFLIKCKPDIDLFKNYKPTVLQNYNLKDIRFKKTSVWSSEQLKLAHPEFYSKELLDEFEGYVAEVDKTVDAKYELVE